MSIRRIIKIPHTQILKVRMIEMYSIYSYCQINSLLEEKTIKVIDHRPMYIRQYKLFMGLNSVSDSCILESSARHMTYDDY